MQVLEGPETEEKQVLLIKEADRFVEIDERIQEVIENYAAGKISHREYEQSLNFYSSEQKTRRAFEMVLDRVQYMDDKKASTGEGLWFVYEKGWDFLTGGVGSGASQDILNALVMAIAMIASYSAVFASEYSSGMIRIINTCKAGRLEAMKRKIRVCLSLTFVFLIIAYLPDIVYSMKYYSLDSIFAPLASLPNMTAFPFAIPVWLYLALLLIARFAVMAAVMFIVLFVSAVSKDTVKCIVITTVIIVVPLIIHLLGIKIVDYFSLNHFLAANTLLNNGIASSGLNITLILFSLIIPVLIILFVYKFLQKRFGE